MSKVDTEHNQGKRIKIIQRLDYGIATVAVLRSLRITNQAMQCGRLARAIGLIPTGGSWKPWRRQQEAEILQVVAAVERQAGRNAEGARIQFEGL